MADVRQGECRPDCGNCCKFVLLEVPPDYERPDMANWLSLHGITLSKLDEATVARIDIPCSALTADNKCSLFGKPERPQMCADWPYNKLSMHGITDCSYTFVPIEDVAIEVG